MMKFPRRLILASIAICWLGSSAPGQSMSGKFGELLQRVPESTNALMLVDVDALLNSKIGVREQWRTKPDAAAAWGIHFPVHANRIVKAASFDMQNGSERWDLGLILASGPAPNLARLAAREHGELDKIQGMQVVRSPRNLFLFEITPNLLGYASPGDRQLFEHWVRTTIVKPRSVVPKFADRAIYRAERTAQIAVALNLENAISPTAAENAIKGLDIIKRLKYDPATIARPISSAKSAILSIEVQEEVRGEIRIEFDQDIEIFRQGAKDIVLAALDNYGADLADFKRWEAGTEGTTIVMTGPLSKESFRRILSLVAPPQTESSYSSYSSRDVAAAPANPPPRSPEQDVVECSQRYFHAIVDLLDGLKGEKSTSYNGMRMWYDRYARRMDELPILNVDKELVDFGGDTARILREMASGINYTSQNRIYRLSNSSNGGYYYASFDSGKSYDYGVIKKQENAILSVQMDGKWQAMGNAIGDMRRKLTERYQVEF